MGVWWKQSVKRKICVGVLPIHTSVLTLDPLCHKKTLDVAAVDIGVGGGGGGVTKEFCVCVCVMLMIKVTIDEKVIFDWLGGGGMIWLSDCSIVAYK